MPFSVIFEYSVIGCQHIEIIDPIDLERANSVTTIEGVNAIANVRRIPTFGGQRFSVGADFHVFFLRYIWQTCTSTFEVYCMYAAISVVRNDSI